MWSTLRKRRFSIACRFLCLFGFAFLFISCSQLNQLFKGESSTDTHKRAKAEDIVLQFDPPSAIVTWGETMEVAITAVWESDQSYPLQVKTVKSPEWLSVTMQPAILTPDEAGVLAISASIGGAELGPTKIHLEASAYGMKRPREFSYPIEIVRQSGPFTLVLTGPVNQECRGICGRISNGVVDFYNLVPEQGQRCDDNKPLPMTQRINLVSYPITDEGFGFGRTCNVALVASSAGEYNLVNINLPGAKVSRGEVLLKLRNIKNLWLSKDNTVALALSGSALTPYDVLKGEILGETCRLVGPFTGATLAAGTLISAGSDRPCTWTIR